MSLFSGTRNWANLVKTKSATMKSPGLTGNNITSSQTFKKRDCCPNEDVLFNNGGVQKTQPNKNGGVTSCDCTN